jgi:hypothetical protein
MIVVGKTVGVDITRTPVVAHSGAGTSRKEGIDMATKAKMKCAVCHKAFKSSKATQTLCDECERKRRKEKAEAPTTPRAAAPKTSLVDGKPVWLVNASVHDDTHPYTTEIPPEARPPAAPRPERPPSNARPPAPAKPERAAKELKAPRPPKPPRVPKPPTPPYVPTPEEIAAIQARYRELAQPEFDGIRTQIAHELHVPKRIVKEVVAELRKREHLPSWWELQPYQGSPEDLERVRGAYVPLLPVPPVGVHRGIAKELSLSATITYQAIGAIRKEMGLPLFNPPELHEGEESEPAEAHDQRSNGDGAATVGVLSDAVESA